MSSAAITQLRDPRRAALIRLLETMNDGLPEPRGQWAGFGAVPGETATRKQPCRSCDETGSVNTRTGPKPCPKCDGKGWYLVDGYTGRRENEPQPPAPTQRLGSLSGPERQEWRHKTDAAIDRTKEQLAVGTAGPQTLADELAEANHSGGYRWERERNDLRKRFDYPALNRALAVLRDRDEPAHALLHSVYVYGWLEPSTVMQAAIERGLVLVLARMPETIRAPGFEHPALQRRNRKAA